MNLKDNLEYSTYGTTIKQYTVSTVDILDGRFETAYQRFTVADMVELIRESPEDIQSYLWVRESPLNAGMRVLQEREINSGKLPWNIVETYNSEQEAILGHRKTLESLKQGKEKFLN